MNKNILLAGAALSVVPSLVAAKAPQKHVQPKQPNIIFILCDDMGYGDLACYGQPYISTPNIDRMAEEGMRFTQAYAGSPVSAPSRASIMTGQHSGHGHVRGNREYWSNDRTVMYGNNVDFAVVGQESYDPQHKILPEMLVAVLAVTDDYGTTVTRSTFHSHITDAEFGTLSKTFPKK